MSIMAKNILEQNILRIDIGFSLKVVFFYCLNSVLHGVFDSNASTSGFIFIGVIQGGHNLRKTHGADRSSHVSNTNELSFLSLIKSIVMEHPYLVRFRKRDASSTPKHTNRNN